MVKKFLVPLHPLSNTEITNCFNDEPIFNGVFSRKNLPRIKDGVYVINLDKNSNNESIMCAFYCIAFIKHTLAGKTLLD